MKQRYRYVDRTKGLAILLVVIGHLVAREAPAGGAGWYLILKHRIYAFHMPLFMGVSGLVYGLSWRPGPTWAADLADGRRRAARLLPSFLLFGLLIFFGKLAAQALGGRVDNPVHGISSLVDLLLRPGLSFTSFLWYVYALAVLYFAFPLAFRATGGRLVLLLLISAAFWLLPDGYWFAWDRLRLFSIFFVVGVAAGRHHELTMRLLHRLWLPALAGFAAAIVLAADDQPVLQWLAAALSLVAVPAVLLRTERWSLGVLETLGRYTLIIYLTNTIFIGVIKVLASRAGLWTLPAFSLIAVVMTLAATVGPIVLKRKVLPHVPPLDRITT